MAVAERVREALSSTRPLPKPVEDRLHRGRERNNQLNPKRDEALEFWRGNQYAHVDEKNVLQFTSTTTSIRGGGKPRHRVREPRNLILDAVAHEVSAATQRVPSYEISPSTTDPEDISAARLAEKVALYGYDQWGLRNATLQAATYAVVTGEAFAWAYWDSSLGQYIEDEGVGTGDVRVRVFSGKQVFWEPGQRFEDSGWHAVEFAMAPEQVEALEGFDGKPLIPDADVLQKKVNQGDTKQVLVTYYLERPGPKSPEGKWLTIANKREICTARGYPTDGDDPCLHKLAYIIDPDSDRDMGLVPHLLPLQRLYNDVLNRAHEIKNLMMVPQVFVSPGLMKGQKLTDEPGAVYQIPNPRENIVQREMGGIPPEIFELADRCQQDLARIAAQNDIPSQVEAGRAIEAIIERDRGRSQSFWAQLADYQSRIMHDCLVLMQEYATEPRLLKIKGRFGWERVSDFKGARLRSQCDVRVSVASIEPRTREAMETKIFAYADRGWISPQSAMHAVETGTAEQTLDDVMLDVERVNKIIQRIEEGETSLFGLPEQVVGIEPQTIDGPPDPMTLMPVQIPNENAGHPIFAPSWMPRDGDNIQVWKSMLNAWQKTESFEGLPVPMQTAAAEIYAKVIEIEQQQQMEAAAAQNAMAAEQGQANAAAPQTKALPDQRAVSDRSSIPTQNQPADQSGPSAPPSP